MMKRLLSGVLAGAFAVGMASSALAMDYTIGVSNTVQGQRLARGDDLRHQGPGPGVRQGQVAQHRSPQYRCGGTA